MQEIFSNTIITKNGLTFPYVPTTVIVKEEIQIKFPDCNSRGRVRHINEPERYLEWNSVVNPLRGNLEFSISNFIYNEVSDMVNDIVITSPDEVYLLNTNPSNGLYITKINVGDNDPLCIQEGLNYGGIQLLIFGINDVGYCFVRGNCARTLNLNDYVKSVSWEPSHDNDILIPLFKTCNNTLITPVDVIEWKTSK